MIVRCDQDRYLWWKAVGSFCATDQMHAPVGCMTAALAPRHVRIFIALGSVFLHAFFSPSGPLWDAETVGMITRPTVCRC